MRIELPVVRENAGILIRPSLEDLSVVHEQHENPDCTESLGAWHRHPALAKSVFHKNTAGRKFSRLTRRVSALA